MAKSSIKELRDAGALIKLVYQAMKNAGIDADKVIRRVGLKSKDIQDSQLRTPHSAQAFFWQTVEEVSADPDIGLHLGEHLPIYKGQVLEYLFLSSPTFGEGLNRAFNYQRLISDAAQLKLDVEGDQGCLTSDFVVSAASQSPSLRHLNEAAFLGLIKFFRYVTDDHFAVSRVDFNHPRPKSIDDHERAFKCEVRFDQTQCRMYFDKAILDHHSAHAEPELLQLHEQLAIEHVAKLEKQDLIGQVNRVIAEVLESGTVNLETVAERLSMKPRFLRGRLMSAGSNFNQVLADYRCQLAKRLLAKTDESIDEIVYLTGFSEPSTFYRAFKRWSGETPIEYRKRKVMQR